MKERRTARDIEKDEERIQFTMDFVNISVRILDRFTVMLSLETSATAYIPETEKRKFVRINWGRGWLEINNS